MWQNKLTVTVMLKRLKSDVAKLTDDGHNDAEKVEIGCGKIN